MIYIADFNCRQHSHETPNAGMLYGLRLAFPEEELVVYGFDSHIAVLKNNFSMYSINMQNIRYVSIDSYLDRAFLKPAYTLMLVYKILSLMVDNNSTKLFFLSFNAFQGYVIKFLLSFKIFSSVQCAFVLHGALDTITGKNITPTKVTPEDVSKKSLWDKLTATPLRQIFKKAVKAVINRFFPPFKELFLSLFTPSLDFKESFLYGNTNNIRYLALSGHILTNLAKYIDLSKINAVSISMPAIFEDIYPRPRNQYLKFAILGYGNSGLLQKLNLKLESYQIKNNYEIRIIGMDSRGIEPYPHVTCPLPRVLLRSEMRELIRDIDIVLILYEKNRYELSCSGSIIEIHSYQKPIFYLDNDCINWFNKPSQPIGVGCKDIDSLAELLCLYIENFDTVSSKIDEFRKNILVRREVIRIENNFSIFHDVFQSSEG